MSTLEAHTKTNEGRRTERSRSLPELRFPEFDGVGEIEKHLFEDVFQFATGKNIKQNEASPEFDTPCVRYGELYHMYGAVIHEVINRTNLDREELLFSKGDEILLPSAGEDPLDIGSASALTLKEVAIGRTINILRPQKEGVYSQIYASYFINQKLRKNIAKLAKGVSISNVYNSDLKKLSIVLPSLPEQQKIASFLSAVDEKIQQLSRKKALLEQYKKGVMQQIFSQQIRFKDENGNPYPDWEEHILEDCLDYEQPTKYTVESTEYDDSYKTPVLTAGKSFILGYTDETNNIFTNHPVIIFDDFTTSSQYVDFNFKVKSSAMKILHAKEEFDTKFLFEALQNIKFEVGGHGRHWISIFSQMVLRFPCFEEQQQISSFIDSMDRKISAADDNLQSLTAFKKGLLQKMFV